MTSTVSSQMLASTNPFDDDSDFNFDNNPFGGSVESSQNTSSTTQGSVEDADFEASTLIPQGLDTASPENISNPEQSSTSNKNSSTHKSSIEATNEIEYQKHTRAITPPPPFSLKNLLFQETKSLLKSPLYSDIRIKVSNTPSNQNLPSSSCYLSAHKFILSAHGFKKSDNSLDMSFIENARIAEHLISWMYTEDFPVELLKSAENSKAALELSTTLGFVEHYRKLVEIEILKQLDLKNYKEFVQTVFSVNNQKLYGTCIEIIEENDIWHGLTEIDVQNYSPELLTNLTAELKQVYPPVQRLVTFNRLDALKLWFSNKNYSNLSSFSKNHPPAIQLALDDSKLEIAQLLSKNQPIDQKLNLIERYISRENPEALKFLLTTTSLTPTAQHIHLYAEKCENKPEILDLLINHGGGKKSFAFCVLNDETAFHVAIRNNNGSGVTHLLSYVENDVSSLEIKDKNGKTPLYSVFEAEMELEVIHEMVNKLNPENSVLRPFFQKFADQPGSIKLLLNFIKPDIQDLNSAIQSNFSETVNILLNDGSIKPDQTSIELIAKNGLTEVLKNIPEEHLIKSQDSLLIAIKSGNFPETSDLLLKKSVCELQNSELYNTLILEENVPAMKYLIQKGSLIKLLTNDLEVLLACTRMGDEEILSKLLSDSDSLLTSFHHSAAMWQALTMEKCENGCDLAALLLSSYSACVDAELDGQLLIQRAIEQKLESAACFLIDSNCTISEEEREIPFSAIQGGFFKMSDFDLGSIVVHSRSFRFVFGHFRGQVRQFRRGHFCDC